MFSSPYGGSYYGRPNPFYYPRQQGGWGQGGWGQQPHRRYGYGMDEEEARARAQALAAQRVRRAQWLPDEIDDPEDEWEYNLLGPRERMYLDAQQRRQRLEQQQKEQELARQRALEDQRWQQQLEQRQKEEDERRKRILEQQKKVQQEKREKEELQRKEREEARLRAEAEAARQQPKPRSRSTSRPPAGASTQIPITISTTSPSPQQPAAQPPQQPEEPVQQPKPEPSPQYDERHEEAASRIQTQYRIHKSLQNIRDLENQFQDAKSRFSFPSSLDFQDPEGEGHISVPIQRIPEPDVDCMDVDGQSDGKLAFTAHNYGVHAYVESLLKLLTKLDGVESWGEKKVRERRRGVVKDIEKEISRVEMCWKTAWRDHVSAQQQS